MLMQVILVLLIFPIILTLYFQKQKSHKNGKKLHPPGPFGLPIIGNLHQFDGQNPHVYLWNLSRKYGPIMSMKLGFRQLVVISSANVVKEVMKSHDKTFSGRPHLLGQRKLSYNGSDVAFSPYNDMWREARKICTLHLFTLKQVQSFRPVREDEVSRMVKRVASNASLSKVNNLSEMVVSMTINIICRTAFGKSFKDDGHEKSRFFDLLHENQALLALFFVSDYLPCLGWIDKLNGMVDRLEKNFRDMDLFYQELIDEHLDYANRPKSMNGDILDLLLELRSNGSSSLKLTWDTIKALLFNIFVAGTDTSAAVIVWGMTYLMKNPTAMRKVQEELRRFAENKDFINEDDIAELPYLRAVIKETFRLQMPSPLLIQRETLQPCNIQGYEIPSGTLVYINAWAIARDPGIWKNPNEFLPERFLENDVDLRGRDPELIPFGIGRRGCPGLSLGMATLELALANLLYKFDWELACGMKKEDIDLDVLPGITMHKKNALCLVAKPVNG